MSKNLGIELRDSSIRIVFYFRGKQTRETLYLDNEALPPTPANIKYARRIAMEVRDKIASGTFNYAEYFPHSPRAQTAAGGTLGDFLDRWYSQLELKASTMATYRRMKDSFWKPQLGHLALDKVKHSDITMALKNGGWSSGKTRNNYVSMLSSVFNLAVADGLVDRNPCDTIEAASWQKKKVDPFTMEEAELILDHMRKKYPEPVANFFEFQFFTGMRTGETIGLEWAAVDLREKTVTVEQAFVVDKMTDTKTSRARTVHLNSRAMAALQRQQAWTRLQEHGRVFQDPGTGKPWAYEQNARKRYWMPTLKSLGIRYRRPYNTRHTYATVGLMAGVNPAYMARQLGHGVDVFLKDYASWIQGQQDIFEMSKIERSIGAQNLPKNTAEESD
jgi:integrase